MTRPVGTRIPAVSLLRRTLLAGLALPGLPAAFASTWPERAVKVVVPWPAGGLVDIPARSVSGKVQAGTGQPFVIENKLGAGGAIGAKTVVDAPPDGYTFCVTTSAICISKALGIKQPFDPIADFEPVALLASAPLVLVATPSTGIRSVDALVERARKAPGKLTFGSAGNGSPAHLAGEWLKAIFSIDLVHVPYKGAPAAMVDQVAGLLDFQFANAAVALPQIRAGKVLPIAVAGPQQIATLPDVPTMDKAGVKGFDTDQWIGLLAPAKTPGAIIDRLSRAVSAALREDDVKVGMEKSGIIIASPDGTPDSFRKVIAEDLARWTRIVATAKIKIE